MATDAPLAGRVAIVTGGARGIGRGIALELARAGADVAIGDLLALPEIAAEAETTLAGVRALGRRALAVACDVTAPEGPQALVAAALRELGGLHVVVANAGVGGAKPVLELSLAEWERVLRVNATGTFLTCQAALPHLVAQRWGAIVNIASIVGLRAAPGRAHYSASKFAVVGFTQALAGEVAKQGVRVSAICPSSVRSPMTLAELMERSGITDVAQADAAWTRAAAGLLALGRSVEPEDIGRAAVFLASAETITGVCLPVTGG